LERRPDADSPSNCHLREIKTLRYISKFLDGEDST
jgi:hypothetical protein